MDSTALALSLAGFGIVLIAISYQRHRHGRDLSAFLHGATGIVLIAGGALLFEVALNLHTYQDLQQDTPLAEISVAKSGKKFQINLMRIPGGDLQVFTLSGSTWTMEARLLHWQRQAPLIGLTKQLRLEQLRTESSGKSTTAESRYTLSHDAGINLWRWAELQTGDDVWLQTELIRTEPQPLEDEQRFHVYLHDNQLLVRQINRAVKNESKVPPATPVLNNKALDLLKSSDLNIPGSTD